MKTIIALMCAGAALSGCSKVVPVPPKHDAFVGKPGTSTEYQATSDLYDTKILETFSNPMRRWITVTTKHAPITEMDAKLIQNGATWKWDSVSVLVNGKPKESWLVSFPMIQNHVIERTAFNSFYLKNTSSMEVKAVQEILAEEMASVHHDEFITEKNIPTIEVMPSRRRHK